MGISDIFPLPSALGLFCAVFRTFAEGFSLNIATFSARLRLIYGLFRIFARRNVRNSAAPQQLEHAPLHSACTSFALEFINNCNYDSTDSFNRGCFHA